LYAAVNESSKSIVINIWGPNFKSERFKKQDRADDAGNLSYFLFSSQIRAGIHLYPHKEQKKET
jgi:hypothetical protein